MDNGPNEVFSDPSDATHIVIAVDVGQVDGTSDSYVNTYTWPMSCVLPLVDEIDDHWGR